MRKTVAQGFYLLLTEMIAVYLVAFPVSAFQVSSSSTGYVRVATAAAISAYQTANKAQFVSAVASAVATPTAASVALRLATGPVGWGLLGVSAALTLAGMYYSSQDIATVRTAALATQPSTLTRNSDGASIPTGATYSAASCVTPCAVGAAQIFFVDLGAMTGIACFNLHGGANYTVVGWPGWLLNETTAGDGHCHTNYVHTANGTALSTAQEMGAHAPTALSHAAAETYINTLSPASATSVESHTSPLGQGATVQAADNTTTIAVSPTEIVPTVKPAAQVVPTDAVIDPNAPPPSGPQAPVTNTQTTTTTTTTTTNPNGSTTTTEADTAVQSCSAGNHDPRTFGSVLQDHMNVWQGSGLLSALTLLKTLSWPSTIPTYSLTSSMFGSFTLDFSAWSGMLTALRSLIIAIASFVAYRIVFVGNT